MLLPMPVSYGGMYSPTSRAWLPFHLKPPASVRDREPATTATRNNCFIMIASDKLVDKYPVKAFFSPSSLAQSFA